MKEKAQQTLRSLPSVEELLQSPNLIPLFERHPRELVAGAVREAVAAARERVLHGSHPETWDRLVQPAQLVALAISLVESWTRPHLRRVLNASGVVVHTNLGRSILPQAAVERVVEAACRYSNLEYDLESGARGSRHAHVEGLLCRLTGAEAAMVVNNNAAAVLLMLAGLATGREVIVSRGQLVEIGGSFRIPDILRLSGAQLVEVGTTNKTRLADYEAAVTSETGLLLRVHTSNFKVMGFAEETSIEELVGLARNWDLRVADDLGSGALAELPAFRGEPTVGASLKAGADVVSFSGDKLLGGPQAGILLGSEETIALLKKHPLARAVRVDKMTLAALEGTLHLYRDPEAARAAIPTLRYLDRRAGETEALATALLQQLERALERDGLRATLGVEGTAAKAGGGSLPLLELPSHAVTVRPEIGSIVALEGALREAPLPVVGRVAQDTLYLDVLTLETEELPLVAESVTWALERLACVPACDT